MITEQLALTALFIFVAICAGLFLCVCISLRKSIDIAVRVMSLAATALEAMPLIVLSPLIQCAGKIHTIALKDVFWQKKKRQNTMIDAATYILFEY